MTRDNPVYAGYLADPFVWRYGAMYYAIGTGALEALGGVSEPLARTERSSASLRLFTLPRSDDLII